MSKPAPPDFRIRFLRPTGIYRSGEVASFTETAGRRFIESGAGEAFPEHVAKEERERLAAERAEDFARDQASYLPPAPAVLDPDGPRTGGTPKPPKAPKAPKAPKVAEPEPTPPAEAAPPAPPAEALPAGLDAAVDAGAVKEEEPTAPSDTPPVISDTPPADAPATDAPADAPAGGEA